MNQLQELKKINKQADEVKASLAKKDTQMAFIAGRVAQLHRELGNTEHANKLEHEWLHSADDVIDVGDEDHSDVVCMRCTDDTLTPWYEDGAGVAEALE